MATQLPSGTVTFLFTDIEGSTRLAQTYPQDWETLRARHHALLHQAMQAHDGFVFQIIGDAFCVAFHTAVDALNAAVLAQRLFVQEPWSPAPIKVRIGINTGTAHTSGDDPRSGGYTGYTSLVRVQRVESVAYGWQILLSNTSAELVRLELPPDIHLIDLQEHRLKGLLNPERLWQVAAPDLPQDFPPLQSLNAIPNNLPIQLTSFIGREKEQKELKELFEKTRLLALTGAGGAGKTRLALQVAADIIDEFSDGVWFVELAPLADPGLIPQTVASILGLREEAGRPALTIVSDYLRAKTALIILDNCEHLIDACAKFADTILHAAPKIKILVTSREALGIAGETAYRVPSLEIPNPKLQISIEQLTQYEAVRLFIDRALAVLPDFAVTNANAPAVAQICYRLDGIPLAIELAAARVKALDAEQIAARLDDRFRLLTGGSRTALPRHQTLRAAIDWSYSLLTDAERILLRRLSVFAGGWTLDAAQAVCSCDPVCADDVLDLLAHLVDKSLVIFERDAARYRLMETIRQYARDRLLEASEAAMVRDRHLDYYLKFAQTAEPKLRGSEQFVWLGTLELEHNNLRAALEWSQGEGRAEQGLELVAALDAFWMLSASWSEVRELVANLLTHPEVAAKNLIRVNGLLVAAHIHSALGDKKTARRYLEELVAIARGLSESALTPLALGLGSLGVIVYGNDFSMGESMVEEGLAIAKSLGTPWITAALLSQKSFNLMGRRDYSAARKAAEEALALNQSIGNKRSAAFVMGRIGEINSNLHDFATARWYLEQSLRFARETQDRRIRSNYLNSLGEIERVEGRYDLAKKYYLESLEIGREIGRMVTVMMCSGNLGYVSLREGDIDSAKSLFTQAFLLARDQNNQTGMVLNLMGFAGILASKQKARVAAQLLAFAKTFIVSGDARNMGPADEKEYEHDLALTRAQLDEATFNSVWAEGLKMTLEQAIALAMEEVNEPAS